MTCRLAPPEDQNFFPRGLCQPLFYPCTHPNAFVISSLSGNHINIIERSKFVRGSSGELILYNITILFHQSFNLLVVIEYIVISGILPFFIFFPEIKPFL